MPRAPSSAPGASSSREQTVALERPRHPQRAGLLGREAEAAVIGRIADQQDRRVAEPARLAHGPPHQRGADAAAAAVGGDRERAEQQRRRAVAAADVPQPHGADDAAAVGGDEGEAVRRQTVFAQALGRLAKRVSPKASSSSASRAAMSEPRS